MPDAPSLRWVATAALVIVACWFAEFILEFRLSPVRSFWWALTGGVLLGATALGMRLTARLRPGLPPLLADEAARAAEYLRSSLTRLLIGAGLAVGIAIDLMRGSGPALR